MFLQVNISIWEHKERRAFSIAFLNLFIVFKIPALVERYELQRRPRVFGR